MQNRLRGRGRCAPEDARDTQVGKTQFRWRLDEWVRIIRVKLRDGGITDLWFAAAASGLPSVDFS